MVDDLDSIDTGCGCGNTHCVICSATYDSTGLCVEHKYDPDPTVIELSTVDVHCVICNVICDSTGLCDKHKYGVSHAITEHAIRMSDGSLCVRPNDEQTERFYPLTKWVEDKANLGNKVYRRQVVVVTDWVEVPR